MKCSVTDIWWKAHQRRNRSRNDWTVKKVSPIKEEKKSKFQFMCVCITYSYVSVIWLSSADSNCILGFSNNGQSFTSVWIDTIHRTDKSTSVGMTSWQHPRKQKTGKESLKLKFDLNVIFSFEAISNLLRWIHPLCVIAFLEAGHIAVDVQVHFANTKLVALVFWLIILNIGKYIDCEVDFPNPRVFACVFELFIIEVFWQGRNKA